MTKQFVMLSGLPRTGSQVLCSMLNQHPMIYASTTSPVADTVSLVGDQWPVISQALTDPYPGQYGNIIKGIILGAYDHINQSVIVDKNRLWPRFIPLTTVAFNQRPKIICTVRSIPDILASYILLIEKNKDKITFIDQDLIDSNIIVNNKNRCKLLLEKYIGHPYASLRMGYNSPNADLLFVEYNDIISDGQGTLDRISSFIGIDTHQTDLNNLQPMDENDHYHGGIEGLHHVRPVLHKTSPPPEQVLGKELSNLYHNMHLEFWRKK